MHHRIQQYLFLIACSHIASIEKILRFVA